MGRGNWEKEEKLEKSGNEVKGEGSSQAGRRKNKEEKGKKEWKRRKSRSFKREGREKGIVRIKGSGNLGNEEKILEKMGRR